MADATKAETIILKKDAAQGDIHYLSIQGAGEVTGDAEITLMLNGDACKTEKLSGPFEFQWQGDWYADTAEVRYTPSSTIAAPGELRPGERPFECPGTKLP